MSNPKTSRHPVDADVGDKLDVKTTAQAFTTREIEGLVLSGQPIDERRRRLAEMREALVARLDNSDGTDLDPLIREIDHATGLLRNAATEEKRSLRRAGGRR